MDSQNFAHINLAKEYVRDIKAALKQFGRYSYFDKGAEEVMEISTAVNTLKMMTAEQIVLVLTEVAKFKDAEPFLRAVFYRLQDWENKAEADALFETDLAQEYY